MLRQKCELELPRFVIDSELQLAARRQHFDSVGDPFESIVFDWANVCFFDDYALLKLILLQRRLRLLGSHVSNRGFTLLQTDPSRLAVENQLWAVGLPELTASGHLVGPEQLKRALEDERILLESNPLSGVHVPFAGTAVVPMLFCHDAMHYKAGSREEKQLDAFVRTSLRPAGTAATTWDLVESRDFRHQMLQQLRRNVQEHSRHSGIEAIGLAIARVWTCRSLSEEWKLTDALQDDLLRAWNNDPVPSLLRGLGVNRGVLQISVLDDGVGIPHNLEAVHSKLVKRMTEPGLFPDRMERQHYEDPTLEERFAEPASWAESQQKARLIAFATDPLGTSKDRVPETKGLQYQRETAVIKRGGAMRIESDGAAVSGFSADRPYGRPDRVGFAWCKTGGTGVCLAVPMIPTESSVRGHESSYYGLGLGSAGDTEPHSERFSISNCLSGLAVPGESARQKRDRFAVCAGTILDKIRLSELEEDLDRLRASKLLVVDWGELPDDKDQFHILLDEIAKGLANIDSRQMRPFIFADLPIGHCRSFAEAIGAYSHDSVPTPVCTFAAERIEPFWLGLESEDTIPKDVRRRLKCGIGRKVTDIPENRTEALYRSCLNLLIKGARAVSANDLCELSGVAHEDLPGIRKTTIARLGFLLSRCSLLREEQQRSTDGESTYSGRFRAVFSLDDIMAEVRSLFLEEFTEVFTSPPVCFKPTDLDRGGGISLPHSEVTVARYFRSDALVDHWIAPRLSQELAAIALGIARQTPEKRIDWIVSCTSPLHWFVHRIVDVLAEQGVFCSHHVFPSYEEIPSSVKEMRMREGESVLVLTDVIASGQTALAMANAVSQQFHAKIVGLIALADIRTSEDRSRVPNLSDVFGDRVYRLYDEPEPHRAELASAYYVHPETVVPTKRKTTEPEKEFFERNFAGVGPLVGEHAYFGDPRHALDVMTSLGALHFGHFRHGTHHSEVHVDVDSILSYSPFRNVVVTALFTYMIKEDIKLVIYPSHSSAYLLADDLKQRFAGSELDVHFVMACRTFSGSRRNNYAITRFSPRAELTPKAHSEPDWKDFSGSPILILDDAICSGATVESIIAELARVDRDYYGGTESPQSAVNKERGLEVHVTTFLNRLPRVTTEFWNGLSTLTSRRVRFSAFVSMPLPASPDELCPQCQLEKELQSAANPDNDSYCQYAKEFLASWARRNAVVSLHEEHSVEGRSQTRFSSRGALQLAGFLSAIDRRAYSFVSNRLCAFHDPLTVGMTEQESKAIRILVRSRAAFLNNLFTLPPASAQDSVDPLVKELASMTEASLDDSGHVQSEDDVSEILQSLIQRYLQMQREDQEVEQVMDYLLTRLAPSFDSGNIVGGVACVLDSGLAMRPQSERADIRSYLHKRFSEFTRKNLPERANLMLDWFRNYLAEEKQRWDSVGKAVLMLAEYAVKGRPGHFYGGYELDELKTMIDLARKTGLIGTAKENVGRARLCAARFSRLVNATRILRAFCPMVASDIETLQNETEQNLRKLLRLCDEFDRARDAAAVQATSSGIEDLYLQIYNLWFPPDPALPRKAELVIGHFTPKLTGCLASVCAEFLHGRSGKNDITIDNSALANHESLRVVIDPSILTTAVRQVLSNVDKYSNAGSSVTVRFRLRGPGEKETVKEGGAAVRAGHVEVVVSNTGTARSSLRQTRPGGLEGVRIHLAEYDGRLRYGVPASDGGWTFEVGMELKAFE